MSHNHTLVRALLTLLRMRSTENERMRGGERTPSEASGISGASRGSSEGDGRARRLRARRLHEGQTTHALERHTRHTSERQC